MVARGEDCRGTFEQAEEPPNAHFQGCTLPSLICSWDRLQHPPRDPERDVTGKKKNLKIFKVSRTIRLQSV